jgi:hypothetical protein
LVGIQNLRSLTELTLGLNGLSDISPLSGLTSLTTLDLFNNSITDISVLSKLTSLTFLDLHFNADLSDVEPLLENTGLDLGATVDLGSTNVSSTDLALLVAKGMTVLPLSLPRSYLAGGYPSTSYSDVIASASGGRGNYVYTLVGGALPAGLSLNSSTGAITGTTMGQGMSFFEIAAASGGLPPASALYSITVSTNPKEGFNMWGVGVGRELPGVAFQEQLDAALARWEAIVTSEVVDLALSDGASNQCGLSDALIDGAFVDDVLLVIDIGSIDFDGPFLGGGRTCWLASSAPFTIVGAIRLDRYEILNETLAGQDLFSLLWHEIGHAMGLTNTHWNRFSYLIDEGGPNPRYVGPGAVLEYDLLSSATPLHVEVENQGPGGTRDTHWRESVFLTEAMTGSLDRGVINPISRMTIRALEDVGWNVDVNQADPYGLPSCTGACVRAPSRVDAAAWELPPDGPTGTQRR